MLCSSCERTMEENVSCVNSSSIFFFCPFPHVVAWGLDNAMIHVVCFISHLGNNRINSGVSIICYFDLYRSKSLLNYYYRKCSRRLFAPLTDIDIPWDRAHVCVTKIRQQRVLQLASWFCFLRSMTEEHPRSSSGFMRIWGRKEDPSTSSHDCRPPS